MFPQRITVQDLGHDSVALCESQTYMLAHYLVTFPFTYTTTNATQLKAFRNFVSPALPYPESHALFRVGGSRMGEPYVRHLMQMIADVRPCLM